MVCFLLNTFKISSPNDIYSAQFGSLEMMKALCPQQTTMAQEKTIIPKSFEEIKQSLDPDYSYLILQQPYSTRESKDFDEIFEALKNLTGRNIGQKIYYDKNQNQFIFIVKLKPGQKKKIMNELHTLRFIKDAIFFIYGDQYMQNE
jgi:hypothetical protein